MSTHVMTIYTTTRDCGVSGIRLRQGEYYRLSATRALPRLGAALALSHVERRAPGSGQARAGRHGSTHHHSAGDTLMSAQPTDAQILALWRWIWIDNGVSRVKPRPSWKRKLYDAWARAGEGVSGYSPELQQLRNQFGPAWLDQQSAQGIERLFLRVRTADLERKGLQS